MGLFPHAFLPPPIMTLRQFAKVFFLAGAMAPSACADGTGGTDQPEARRPNIVFVLLDDVRYDDVIDHPFADLPNLARLTREGASFRRFFTSAPLCSPSRAVFMTGQYPFRNGITDNTERAELSHRIVTFPKLLHDAGYTTGFFGKWHMSPRGRFTSSRLRPVGELRRAGRLLRSRPEHRRGRSSKAKAT